MEVAAKYRAIAFTCLLIASISALGRWNLASIRPTIPPKPVLTSGVPSRPRPEPAKLPSPSFLKFAPQTVSWGGSLDLADDGSILQSEADPHTGARTYSFIPNGGRLTKLESKDALTQYALSQRGRLFRFSGNPARLGFGRRATARLTMADLMAQNSGPFGAARRFLNDGSRVNYDFKGTLTEISVLKEGLAPSKIYASENQVLVGQIDEKDELWIWEVRTASTSPTFRLTKGRGRNEIDVSLPASKGVPKVVTSTNGTCVLTVCDRGNSAANRAFRLVGKSWQEILPPPGFTGVIIQKITFDGLMFGALQIESVDLIPAVWKDGVAYDLRRHPQWPLGGQYTFAEIINRRGDLVASSIGSGDASDRNSVLMRRLPAK